MRVLTRAAAVLAPALLLTVAGPYGAAHAEDSNSCPESQSTRLATGNLLGDPAAETKLWVYEPSNTRTVVCFALPAVTVPGSAPWALGRGAIVIDAATGATLPTVTPGSDPTACTVPVIDFEDPVPVEISLGASGSTVCLTVNGSTTSIAVGLPGVGAVPSVQVWREGSPTWERGTYLNYAFCGVYELASIATSDPALRAQYEACMATTTRIV